MVRTSWIRICVALTLLVSTVASYAQITTAQLLKGEGPASKLAINDLPEGFRGVELKFAGAASGVFETMFGGMLGAFSSMAQGGENSMPTQFVTLMGLHFANGESIEVDGSRYLVTYRFVIDAAKASPGMSGPPTPEVVSWQLTLVNPATIQQMSPHPEWTAAAAKDAVKKAMAQVEQIKVNAQSVVAQNNMKQIAMAVVMYQADNDDILPPVVNGAQMRAVLYPYVKDSNIFLSKGEKPAPIEFNLAIAGVSQEHLANPAEIPVAYEPEPWPDGKRWVAFLDGHVKQLNPYEFAKLKSYFEAKYPRQLLYEPDFMPGPDPLASPSITPQESPRVGNKGL